MRKLAPLTAVAALLLLAGTAPAAEKFDAAARAKIVAPLLDDQAFLVVRVDLSRLPAAPILALVGQWVPEAKQDVEKAGGDLIADLAAFLKAGGKDVYFVVTMADISLAPPHNAPFAVVPLAPGADEAALTRLLLKISYTATQRADGVLVASSVEGLQRLKSMKPAARPEVVHAFEAAGNTAAQALFIPPAYWNRVIEEMMPTLPAAVGGGSSTVLTHGVRWAALGVDPPLNMSLRLVIQSRDPEAAKALRKKWSDVWQVLKQDPEIKPAAPKLDEMVRLFTPEVQGDRLVLSVGQERIIAAVVAFLKPAPEKPAVENAPGEKRPKQP